MRSKAENKGSLKREIIMEELLKNGKDSKRKKELEKSKSCAAAVIVKRNAIRPGRSFCSPTTPPLFYIYFQDI